MKRLLAVAAVLAVMGGGLLAASSVSAQPEPAVDEALVNAKIDARLLEVLQKLRRSTRAGVEGATPSAVATARQ